MQLTENASLLRYNTFGIDVNADYLIEYSSVEELREVLSLELLRSNRILHIGGGSNLLFLSDFDGVILHSKIVGIEVKREDENHIYLEVGAGVVWDELVAYCVQEGWGGVENLSLIPGEVGASAVQNIGAYGVEVQDVIVSVSAMEIATLQMKDFSNSDCCYGYRESVFKNALKGKYIITSVVFKLDKTPVFKLQYQHLESEVLSNGALNLQTIRNTIMEVRESKLPDPQVAGNAGSFFMNPVISRDHFAKLQLQYPTIPHYFISATEEKIPAGWLIDQCGWKGKQLGNAAVHDKQALVIVNVGDATGAEIVALAEQIQVSVQATFGIQLQAEVNYI